MEHRVSNIVSAATERVFCYACLGLFERHKLIFASHLSLRIKVLPPPLVPHVCHTAADQGVVILSHVYSTCMPQCIVLLRFATTLSLHVQQRQELRKTHSLPVSCIKSVTLTMRKVYIVQYTQD